MPEQETGPYIDRQELLERMRGMMDRIGPSASVVWPQSAAAEHYLRLGHIMRGGCCRESGALEHENSAR